MDDKDTKLREEVLANWQLCHDEIRFFKQQQWQVIYYCLLLLTAIVFIKKNNYICASYLKPFIYIVGAVGSVLLLEIQWSLYKHRKIIKAIQEDFEEKTKNYLDVMNNLFSSAMKHVSPWLYFFVFLVMLWMACGVVRYIVIH